MVHEKFTRKGGVIWLTGLPGAGKSTLAVLLHERLSSLGLRTQVLDGDVVREHLTRELGFTREDRNENIRRIGYVARMLASHGVWVIVAAIAPYRKARAEHREKCESEGVTCLEVYVRCPLEVVERRDPKGLYKKARAGQLKHFTGISDPYEPPENPDLVIDTSTTSADDCAAEIVELSNLIAR